MALSSLMAPRLTTHGCLCPQPSSLAIKHSHRGRPAISARHSQAIAQIPRPSQHRGKPPQAAPDAGGAGASTPAARWRRLIGTVGAAAAVGAAVWGSGPVLPALARPAGVNRPDLLPRSFTPVIDVAGFLAPGQEVRLASELIRLERETGFKLRVLAQNYPETPGLAVKEFWSVDDRTVVFVADPSLSGNILNFNVGAEVDLQVPRSFWSRLAGKYGNIFFWRENGEDVAIENAVAAIDVCLREPPSPQACARID